MSTQARGVVITLLDHEASSAFEIPTKQRLIYVKQHQLELVYTKLLRVLKNLKHPSMEQHIY